MSAAETQALRPASDACERAFGFLIGEYGYERKDLRVHDHGFALRYGGPVMGVQVDWYPRDPLTVWLVRLADGQFPDRYVPTGPHTALAYFDLRDLAAFSGFRLEVSDWDLYRMPDDRNAQALAACLRTCGDELLRGDLTRIPLLEQRIRDRARAQAIEMYGPDAAKNLGW